MQRITITIDDDLLEEIDNIAKQRKYQNRSEAIRDLARAGILATEEQFDIDANWVGALIYVFENEARELSKRLTKTFHSHHDLSVASLHVHLDEDNCLEVSLLKGKVGEVQHLAEGVIAERGVKHGKLMMVPIEADKEDKSAHHHEHK